MSDPKQALWDAVQRHHEGIPGSCWLRLLTNSYEAEHHWTPYEDTAAIREMLRACRELADAVEATVPQPDAVETIPDPELPY